MIEEQLIKLIEALFKETVLHNRSVYEMVEIAQKAVEIAKRQGLIPSDNDDSPQYS